MLALVAAPSNPARVELRAVPEPAPGPSEALLDVHAVSLNRGEVNRAYQAKDGWRPGWDVAGVVLRPAADGSGPREGARVVGLLQSGGWCERVAVPTTQLAEIPDGLDFGAASTLPVAGLTALRALHMGGRLLGKRVLITGGAGGVGRIAIQLARRGGAHVTAVVGRPERGEGLRALGADGIVVGLDALAPSGAPPGGPLQDAPPSNAGTPSASTAGASAASASPSGQVGPFDLIVESIGGEALGRTMRLVARGGMVVTLGNSAKEPTTFDTREFFSIGGARLYGFHLVLHEMVVDPVAADLGYLARLVADGALDPQIALEASWRDAGPALAALLDRRIDGKAVLQLH